MQHVSPSKFEKPRYIDNFLYAESLEEQLAVVGDLEQKAAPIDFLRAGEMLVDCAYRSDADQNTKLDLLKRAKADWDTVLQRHWNRPERMQSIIGRTMLQLACEPLYSWLSVHKSIAPRSVATTAFEGTLRAAYHSLESFKSTPRGELTGSLRAHLLGNLSEMSVLLLLQRQSTLTSDDDQLVAVPSFISQDVPNGDAASKWDVSVYTQYDKDDPLDLTYKAQIKSYFGSATPHDSDVALVNAMSDLSLSKFSLQPGDIITECVSEYHGDKVATGALNQRTDRLVDILDRAA